VVCHAKDPESVPRSIKEFDTDYYMVGGGLIETAEETLVGYTGRQAVGGLA